MLWTVEEEFQKNKNMMRLERSGSIINGDGDTCVEEKKTREKKKKRKGKEMYVFVFRPLKTQPD